jgi:hypothetical protein
MKPYPALLWLVAIIALCALLAAGLGPFTPKDGSLISFTTARGETVEVWGQGLYKYDTPIGASGFVAADVNTGMKLGIRDLQMDYTNPYSTWKTTSVQRWTPDAATNPSFM